MNTLAFIGPAPTVRDVGLSAGLLLAAILLAILASWHVRSAPPTPRKLLLGFLTFIGLAAIVWSMSEAVSRLIRLRRTIETVNSIQQFCFELSDSDWQGFGVRLDTDTWERVHPDGYQRLIARARSEGRLRDSGANWSTDGGLVDFWQHPFRIAVSVQGGKRLVIVDSLGLDGIPNTIDDIQRSDSREIPKRQ
jgi:hypothetical protein